MNPKKIEFWGLVIVLLSSFIQLFVLMPSQSDATASVLWKLETKLDLIFAGTRSNARVLHPESDIIIHDNLAQLNNYPYVNDKSLTDPTEKFSVTVHIIFAILFIIGSLLTAYGKLQIIRSDASRDDQLSG